MSIDPVFNHVSRHFGVYVGAVIAVSAGLWVLGVTMHGNQPNLWVGVLFLLPTSVQVCGLLSLYRTIKDGAFADDSARKAFAVFYILTMVFCLLGYSGLSLRYLLWEKDNQWDSSYLTCWSALALVLISFLLIFAIRMTHAIMSGSIISNDEREYSGLAVLNVNNLKTGAARVPFLTLLFFITIFLGVSYLFGLALAFHDKGMPPNNPALYMMHLYTPPPPSPSPTPHLTDSVNASSASTLHSFNFKSGEALLAIEEPPPLLKESDRDVRERDRRAKGGMHRIISDLVDEIIAKTKHQKRVRIEIVGHSDDKDIKESKSYKSNYELAIARAENTKLKILKELSFRDNKEWLDIDWVCLSESNEGGRNVRSVEVYVKEIPQNPLSSKVPNELLRHAEAERPDPLNLMDYMYFANYTITTTGYGDIVPTTAYAKFICSFANICEVFFLVVLFNALLSLKEDHKEKE